MDMKKKTLSLVGIQMTPTQDKEENLKNALALVDEAFARYKHVDMIVLPEYFYHVVPKKQVDSVGAYPEAVKTELSKRAKKHSAYIIAGTVANRKEDGKVYNTSVMFGRDGEITGEYSKIHLFDVLGAMGGVNESDYITRGDEVFAFETDFGKIGIIICYDIRFPELARTLALQGVQYLLVPAAFYSPRIDHWQDILRVTALQNSMYVMGVNLFGKLDDANVFCGRSIISDPWGIPVATASDKPAIIQTYIDIDYASEIRDAIGTIHNRVPSLYDI
jgi:predicted amidohydrolase